MEQTEGIENWPEMRTDNTDIEMYSTVKGIGKSCFLVNNRFIFYNDLYTFKP